MREFGGTFVMKMLSKFVLGTVAAAGLAAGPANAVVSFTFDTLVSDTVENSGDLVVTVTEIAQINGVNAVELTVDATAFTNTSEFVNDIWFNIEDNLDLSVVSTSGSSAEYRLCPSVDGCDLPGPFTAGGGRGEYDLWLDFTNKGNRDRFQAGEKMTFTLTGTNLSEDSFSFGTNTSSYGQLFMVAKLQGLAGGQSTHMGATTPIEFCEDGKCDGPPPEQVPAPAALGLMGLGLLGLGLRRRQRSRAAA